MTSLSVVKKICPECMFEIHLIKEWRKAAITCPFCKQKIEIDREDYDQKI